MKNDQVETIPAGVKFILLLLAYLIFRCIYIASYPKEFSQYPWEENMMRPIFAALMMMFLGTIMAVMALVYLLAYYFAFNLGWALITLIIHGDIPIKEEKEINV
jgi:hypothetical protein